MYDSVAQIANLQQKVHVLAQPPIPAGRNAHLGGERVFLPASAPLGHFGQRVIDAVVCSFETLYTISFGHHKLCGHEYLLSNVSNPRRYRSPPNCESCWRSRRMRGAIRSVLRPIRSRICSIRNWAGQ